MSVSPENLSDVDLDILIGKLDLKTKVQLISGASAWTTVAVPDIDLRSMTLSDGPIGVRGASNNDWQASAALPCGSAMGAAWDADLLRRVGHELAREAHRKGVDVVLGPTINMHRSPLGGRHFECFSEDPLLSGRLATAYVLGVQERGVGACPKHYVANDAETNRMTVDNVIDERALRELYLAPYEAVVSDADPWMIMAAYNGVNGKPLTENELLAEPLKGEWGFDGVVVSDWGAVYNGEPSARAALDLAMPGPEAMWGEPLVEAVQAGRVLEADIDAKVRRLLLLASRVGALGSGAHLSAAGPSGRPEDASPLAREAAAAATVLIRNESILPLEPENLRRIALIGPGARNPRQLGGGSATVFPPYLVTPFAGLTNALAGQANVVAAVGAELGDGLRPMRVDELARDDGADPASVRWLDAQGQVVLAHGSATTLLIRAVPEVPAGTVALELGCRFIPDQDGRWQLGVSGFGAHQLHLNGNKVIDEQWILTGDPHEVFSAPPEHSIGVDLQAGQAVEVLLRYEWTTDADIIFAGLAVAAPRLSDEEELARAVDLARTSDVAVVVVGTSEAVESEGIDRRTMFLPGRQDELVRAVAAVNPRTVVVVNAGAPVEMPWREDVAAILVAWFPGMEFGNALADVLLGTTEPGGRLPTSWPAVAADAPVLGTTPTDGRLVYQEGLEIGHRGYFANGTEPAYWFGHGLGYTTWEYQSIGTPVESSPDRLTATVRLRNTGSRRGKQVVQVYAARPGSAIRRPVRCLAGFASVNVEPGAVADVPVVIDRRVLRHWDVDARAWVIEPGKVLLSTGPHAGDQRVSASMTLLRGTREDT